MALSFHGDPALKADALTKLRRHIANGTFLYSTPADPALGASAISSVVESGDPQEYADRLGYPVPLVLVLHSIVNSFGSLPEAADFAEAWLERTPVGADLSRVVPEAIVTILEDPALIEVTRRHGPIEDARQSVLDLRRRALAGETISRSDWKEARSAALAATDGASKDRMLTHAGGVAESAAWPSSMRTVLADALAARIGLELRVVLGQIGWTDSDEKRVFEIMDAAQGRHTNLKGLERVHAVLGEDDPELAPRFRERLENISRAAAPNIAIGERILELLSAAPGT